MTMADPFDGIAIGGGNDGGGDYDPFDGIPLPQVGQSDFGENGGMPAQAMTRGFEPSRIEPTIFDNAGQPMRNPDSSLMQPDQFLRSYSRYNSEKDLPPVQQDRGLLEGVRAGAARGLANLNRAMGGIGNAVVPGFGDAAVQNSEDITAAEPPSPSVANAKTLGEKAGNWRWYTEGASEMVPTLLAQLGALYLTKGQSANAQFAAFTAPMTAEVVGNTYQTTLDRTGSQQLATGEALLNGIVSTAVQKLNLGVILNNPAAKQFFQNAVAGKLAQVGVRGLESAGTNAVGSVVQSAAEDTIRAAAEHDPEAFKDWSARYMATALHGAATGLGLSLGHQAMEGFGGQAEPQQPLPRGEAIPDLQPLPRTPIPTQDDMLRQVMARDAQNAPQRQPEPAMDQPTPEEFDAAMSRYQPAQRATVAPEAATPPQENLNGETQTQGQGRLRLLNAEPPQVQPEAQAEAPPVASAPKSHPVEISGGQGKTIDLPDVLYHGSDKKITGPLKPGEDGVVWYGTTPEKAKFAGKNSGGNQVAESPPIKKVFITGLTGELSSEAMKREADAGTDALYDPDKGHIAYIGHLRDQPATVTPPAPNPKAGEAIPPPPATDPATMNLRQPREAAKPRGLDVRGSVGQLRERLKEAQNAQATPARNPVEAGNVARGGDVAPAREVVGEQLPGVVESGGAPAGEQRGDVGAVKQPWEMTKEEWASQVTPAKTQTQITPEQRANNAASHRLGFRQRQATHAEPFWSVPGVNIAFKSKSDALARGHRLVVERALAEGHPVPPEVLADYPDLSPPPRVAPPSSPDTPAPPRGDVAGVTYDTFNPYTNEHTGEFTIAPMTPEIFERDIKPHKAIPAKMSMESFQKEFSRGTTGFPSHVKLKDGKATTYGSLEGLLAQATAGGTKIVKRESPSADSPPKSLGHLAFRDGFEYFEREGNVHRAQISSVVMPDGYRSGRFESTVSMWPRHPINKASSPPPRVAPPSSPDTPAPPAVAEPARAVPEQDPGVQKAWRDLKDYFTGKVPLEEMPYFSGPALDPELQRRAVNLGVAIVKAGYRSFKEFAQEIYANVQGKVRQWMLNNARDIYNEVRGHPAAAEHAGSMTPLEEMPKRTFDVFRMASDKKAEPVKAEAEPPAPPEEPPAPPKASERIGPNPSPLEDTSARKADMTKDRAALGLDTLNSPERRGWEEVLQTAKDQGLQDKAMRIASDVLAHPRALSDVETAGVVLKAVELKKEVDAMASDIAKADNDTDVRILTGEFNRAVDEFDSLSRALRASGTEKGRALASQKLTVDRDFSLASVLARAKASKGKNLTDAERTSFSETIKALEEKNSQLETRLKEQADAHANEVVRKARVRNRLAPELREKTKADLYKRLRDLLVAGCHDN